MGIGLITIPAAGVVTAPEPFPLPETLTVSVFATVRHFALYPWRFALAPTQKMLLAFNGVAPPLNLIGATLCRTGILAPYEALTVAGTGTKASARFDSNHGGAWTPTDGDYIELVNGGGVTGYSWRIYVALAANGFSTSGARLKYWQVAGGASVAACLDNLKLLVNGTGIDGTNYRSPTIDPERETADHPAAWSEWITATTNTDTDQTFEAAAAGQKGNTYAIAYSGSANPRTEVDGADTATAVFTTGTAGTGTAPNFPGAGDFAYAYRYGRTLDGFLSGISPVTEHSQLDPGETDLSQIDDAPASLQESIDFKAWVRSLGDGAADVLHEGYRIASNATTDDDDLEDDEIDSHELYDPAIHRTWADGFVPRHTSVVTLKDRLFAAGRLPAADYSFGVAAATNGLNTVTLSASGGLTPTPTLLWEGRTFRITTSALTEATVYRIVYVVPGTKVLHLDRAYEGGTDTGLAYTVSDRADAFATDYSETKLPNNWPSANNIGGPLSPNPAGVTAAITAFESVIQFTLTGGWGLTGTTPPFRILNLWQGAGCVGPNAVDEGGGYIYWVALDGLYRWDNRGIPVCISARPQKNGDLVGVRETFRDVNHAWSYYSVVCYSPATKRVYFFMPFGDEVTNRYALVFDTQTETWAFDSYGIDVTYAKVVKDRSGANRLLLGTLHGEMVELETSNSDGGYGFEQMNAITSSTRRTVTCSGASFPTTGLGLAGLPVTFVDASGNFTYNTIESNTGTVLTLTRLVATAPTGTACVGAIHAYIESGRFHLGDPTRQKPWGPAHLAFSPDVDGVAYVSAAADQGEATVLSATGIDLTATTAREQVWVNNAGRLLKVRIDVLEPGCDPRFIALRLDVMKRAMARV